MKLFCNIKELLTLEKAFQKDGKNIKTSDLSIIKNAAILEENGKIKKVGSEKDMVEFVEKKGLKPDIEDCQNMVALPGFVDCHTHPVFNCSRFWEFEKRIEGASYLEISSSGGGINSAIKGTRSASKETLKKSASKYFQKMLSHGTTTVEAKSGYGLSTESEIKMLEVIKDLDHRLPINIHSTFLGAHAFPPEYKDNEDGYIDLLVNEMLPQVKELKLARFCDVFCDKGFFSNKQTETIVRAAKDMGFDITLHVDELKDTDGTALAVDLDALSASHLLCVNEKNIKKLSKSKTVGIMLPGTPFFLAINEYAPARRLCDEGAYVAISTDFNPGSNMCYSMPLTMTIAALMQKMTLAEVIVGGTYLGAKALGIEKEVGSLFEGKNLDMALFDTSCYQEIFCHYGENHCRKVYISGLLTGDWIHSTEVG